jgi:hypothetical protein
MLDILAGIFWYGILATPLIAFLIVRKRPLTLSTKIWLGAGFALSLAIIFLVIAMKIYFRNGLA